MMDFRIIGWINKKYKSGVSFFDLDIWLLDYNLSNIQSFSKLSIYIENMKKSPQ